MIWRMCISQETILHFRISGTNLRNAHQIRSTQVRIGWITREGHKWACLDKMHLTMLVTRTTNTNCKLAKTTESDRKWFTSASETLLVLSSLGSHLGPGCQKACNVTISLVTLGPIGHWQVNLSQLRHEPSPSSRSRSVAAASGTTQNPSPEGIHCEDCEVFKVFLNFT